jgi:hypothetical protein
VDDGPSPDLRPEGSSPDAEPDPGGPPIAGRPDPRSDQVVLALIVGAAVAGALADADPTGFRVPDVVWCALAAGAVTWAASRASAVTVVVLAAVAAVVGVGGGWLPGACGLAALVVGVVAASEKRPSRELATLAGALAMQALLRGPSYGFVGLPTLVAVAAVAPVLVSGLRRAPSTERRVVRTASLVVVGFVLLASLGAGLAALLARDDLRGGASEAESALQLLRDGDLDAAVGPLAEASDGFSSASGILDGPLAFAGRAVPIVGQHLDALSQVSSAGDRLTTTAGEAATSADYESLKADNGRVDLDEVRAMTGPVAASAEAAVDAQRVVADVRNPWLVSAVTSELDRLEDELADTVPAAVDAATALELAPMLLGGDGEQRYLLQFATPGESRGAGGFIGTYAVLVADDGQLDLGITGSTQELGPDLVDPTTETPPFPVELPEGWDDLYASYNVEFFPGNLSASPDWPTDSDVARQIYAQVPEVGETDGVLYADPAALAALLSLTGPIDVEGVEDPLDEDNVEQYLYVDQYVQYASDLAQRRDVLAEVTSGVFEALTSRPLPALGELTSTLGPVVASGHLKFVSFDDAAEELFVRTGLAGAWKTTPGADWLSLRSANLLPNKIDWFLRRDMAVDTLVDPATGAVESTVTVTLTNLAPPGGLPEYMIGNVDGLPSGTNQDALSLFTPHGLESVTVDGAEVGGESGVAFGGNVYTVAVDLPPEGTRTVVFRLAGAVPAGALYQLDLLAQPLAHEDEVTVTLRGAGGSRPLTLFEGPLTEDTQLAAIGRS